MARRAVMNLGDCPEATERYAWLAMKARAGARTTLETLSTLQQSRERIVRHAGE
jgi:hypothetical protein